MRGSLVPLTRLHTAAAAALGLTLCAAPGCKAPPSETTTPEEGAAASAGAGAGAPVHERREHLWEGGVALPNGQVLGFAVKFTPEGDGYKGALSIPLQGLLEGELSDVALGDGKIAFTLASVGARFTGTVDEDYAVECELAQGPARLPCEMDEVDARRYASLITPNRPQEPKPPFPYEVREVEYDTPAGVHLAGTLTLPEGPGPHPAALLISGSGAQDRDEALMGHKPFWVLADALTREGVAVLRVDDRGVGKSSGDTAASTTDDFAGDALAGLAWLQQQPEIDPKKIGFIGHSEGAVVGPLAASRSQDVAFVIMLAGTGVTGAEVVTHQGKLIAERSGAPSDAVARSVKDNEAVFKIVAESKTPEEARPKIRAYLEQAIAEADAKELAAAGVADPKQHVEDTVKQVTQPWFWYFLTYDPRPALRALKAPVLVLNGELDLQVDPAQNLPEIEKALKKARNRDVTIKRLPGLNHLFQEANTGLPMEYATIEQTMSPQVLELLATWINERVGSGTPAKAPAKASAKASAKK
ncbi:MAG: alpha/beta fold hydrolase [Myxococcales bacterium]|nr:alpha/beta fold hydrolase [Myxococcales bacterium]